MTNTTIKDVAKKSGYSLATVSRVLGGSEYPVSAKTREEVIEAAKSLGYVSNILARSLKTCISHEIAVIVPNITNPFYNSLVSSVETTLSDAGYNISVLIQKPNNIKKDIISEIRGRMIDGVLIAADCIFGEIINQISILNVRTPCIVFDYIPKSISNVHGVFFDYYAGGRAVADYLLNKGHERIAFVTKTLNVYSRVRRFNGFKDAMYDSDAKFDNQDVFTISSDKHDFEAGHILVDEILKSNKQYSAIVASNDAMAVGVISSLNKHHLYVPNDYSVIGFDDCVFSQMTTPLLTTVRVSAEYMGELSANMLLEYLHGKITENIFISPIVVERESVKTL